MNRSVLAPKVDSNLTCPICRRSYGNKINLRSHMRRSHAHGRDRLPKPKNVVENHSPYLSTSQNVSNTEGAEYHKPDSANFAECHEVEMTENGSAQPHESERTCAFEDRHEINNHPNVDTDALESLYKEDHTQFDAIGSHSPFDGNRVTPHQLDWSTIHGVRWNVSRKVSSFYDSFGDTSERLYPKQGNLFPPLEVLDESSKDLLEFCMRLQLTLGEARALYELVISMEGRLPAEYRLVSMSFSESNSFVVYLDKLRKWKVKEEGWQRAVIKTSFGTNRTGVFRSVRDLVLSVLDKAGRTSTIQPYEESTSENQRVFTGPYNSEAMGEFHRSHRLGGKVLGFDVYSDGTILAKSGSQSANCVRVRLTNVKGYSNQWFEVGITPTVHSGDDLKSDSEKRRERCQLFQRFLYLLLRDSICASHDGVMYKGEMIFLRMVMVVADQPQERVFFCLKGSDSYSDFSICLMPSRVKIHTNETPPPSKRGRSDERNDESMVGSLKANSTESMRKMVFERQTSRDSALHRDVQKTVSAQIILAESKLGKDEQSIQANRYAPSLLKTLRQHLEEVSAIEFPPVLASFAGFGTSPFRLYKSIAFDKLHVLEHGILRQITDEAFRAFESCPAYYGISRGEIVTIANQRLLALHF